MSSGEKEFDRKHQRNLKKLDKLSSELDQLDLSPLSEQVRNPAATLPAKNCTTPCLMTRHRLVFWNGFNLFSVCSCVVVQLKVTAALTPPVEV